jgi:hypothetical protein
MKIWEDYKKVLSVIDSCVTIEQLKGASKMLLLWSNKYLDDGMYSSTFKNHIQKKFYELGGIDPNDLYYVSYNKVQKWKI